MRLLDAETLELVDVRDDAVPRYAILSHTWGDEEITIQELRRMNGRLPQALDKQKRAIGGKQGFVKVKNAARLALRRGLSYIWVDTCCIDKSSSAELSEAINSMYSWYQQSAECYAFLSDVQAADKEDWARPGSSLQRSRWFTRGWTLQELVAPKAVLFYAKDWTLLGHKDSPAKFMAIISWVTGIDDEVLDGRIDPLHLSASTRMAWAAHRHTTRIEDTAYSLMGLFQVNMPLLYGEGHRAFTRLQEEIIQRTDDQSLFAWTAFDEANDDPDALFGLLAHSPAYFKEARKIQPLPPLPIYASAPSSITNHGLRVQVYLRPVPSTGADTDTMEEDYFAILDCFIRDGDLYRCPVLRLRRLSEDQYARLQPKTQMFLPPPLSDFMPELEGYRAIYVRQRPVYYHLPQFRISPFHMPSGATTSNSDGVEYRLTDTYPPSEWNSSTMTLKANYSRKLRAMGVFRFENATRKDERVDVVVGLRRLNAMQWEGWCFQLFSRTKALEATFADVNGKIEKMTSARRADLSSRALRDALGDDAFMTSNATVEGIQLQGRLYISVLVSPTQEIQTSKILDTMPPPPELLTKHGAVRNSLFQGLWARELTESFFDSDWNNSEFMPAVEFNSHVSPVRARPPNIDGLQSTTSHFMNPIYNFIVELKEKKKEECKEDVPSQLLEDLAVALLGCDSLQVEKILEKSLDLEAFTSDKYGFAPLHWAVAGGSTECLNMLLEHGVNILSTTKGGLTALHVSALCKTRVWSVLAARYGPETGLGDLGASRTKKHLDTPLHVAAAACLDSVGDVSFFDSFMDFIKSTETVSLFAQNKDDETPLHRAAANNNSDVVRALAAAKPYFFDPDTVDKYGRSALWHAAATGSCEAIEALTQLHATIDLTDDLGRSPLHAACRGGHSRAVELLLRKRARQETQTHVLSLTAMDYAAMFGHAQCLRLLLNMSDSDIVESYMLLPLHERSRALHIAASCGWIECVKILYQAGADPATNRDFYFRLDASKSFAVVVDVEGATWSVAAREGHTEISEYLGQVVRASESQKQQAVPQQQQQPHHEPPVTSRPATYTSPSSAALHASPQSQGVGYSKYLSPEYQRPEYSGRAHSTPGYSAPGYASPGSAMPQPVQQLSSRQSPPRPIAESLTAAPIKSYNFMSASFAESAAGPRQHSTTLPAQTASSTPYQVAGGQSEQRQITRSLGWSKGF